MTQQLVLGLGSNLGWPLDHLRLAVKHLQRAAELTVKKISPVYKSAALLPPGAPVSWDRPFLNLAIACETTTPATRILQFVKEIERAMGRQPAARWAPRVIDIDLLAYGNALIQEADLTIPHPDLTNRPFALWPLLDVWPEWKHSLASQQSLIVQQLATWGSRDTGQAPFGTCRVPHRIDTPALVGIVNVTPDSFSDGGEFNTPDRALAQVERLFAAGAEVIDIGAESTCPGAKLITPEREWQILQPVLQQVYRWLQTQVFKPKISIDTRHYQTVERALPFEIDWINDVGGFNDDNLWRVVVGTPVKCVLMHQLGVPPVKGQVLDSKLDPVAQVITWAQQRMVQLMEQGIRRDQLIFDVGIGFGKDDQQNLSLIHQVAKFHCLDLPLLIGHSRKLFLGQWGIRDPKERDLETVLLSFYLALQKNSAVDYLRVHQMAWHTRAMRLAAEFVGTPSCGYTE